MLKQFTVKGKSVACWVNPDNFGSHGQSLVFIHGSGSNSTVWSFQYANLHQDFNIIAVDLPGHGQSEGDGEQDIAAYVGILEAILDTLKLKRPVLIGHSLGAAIALGFAAVHPEEISGVVAAGGGLTMPVNPDIIKGFLSQPDIIMDIICKISLAKANRPVFYDAIRASLAEARVEVMAGDMTACSKFDLTGDVNKIKTPLLVVCGTEDKMTPPASSEKIAAEIPGVKLVLIEGAGHMAMMEKPEDFNQAVKDFCESIR
ncbi:MAG: 4,5:9,10-diseco-3-hydroxy-5,9,17-trioxoandrosta-1(10),2-diene-4-oate hydrolase [Deltaproteobacteria bacterium ADurb.Bin151]|nr:MAG: 4,5:9,10-diseco-3-hydroxy-5,9,17-trioxoandrosta-1(10),2-diene-4-oate hydrolase [Deltaproteobacteria bacterium ADurb.Bin151]